MRRKLLAVVWLCLLGTVAAQTPEGCSCGAKAAGRPAKRTMKPYAQEPEDLRPFSKFTTPYFENYTDTVEYNGAARDVVQADPNDLTEIRIGFIGPLQN